MKILQRLFGKPAAAPPPRPRPLQPEERSIDDIVFCAEREPTLGPTVSSAPGSTLKEQHPDLTDAALIELWNKTHADARAAVRATLRSCGVEKAGDINMVGCTGAVKSGLTVDAASALILDLAGSGFGLPCFVPQTRYCLVHKTIGGLQDGQKQHHTDMVEKISRELTPEERGKVKLVEASRRIRGKNLEERLADTVDALSGEQLPAGFASGYPQDEVADGTLDPIIGDNKGGTS